MLWCSNTKAKNSNEVGVKLRHHLPDVAESQDFTSEFRTESKKWKKHKGLTRKNGSISTAPNPRISNFSAAPSLAMIQDIEKGMFKMEKI